MPRWNRKTIKSDDPQAARKLADRVTELRRKYQMMKAANRLRKKGGPNLERKLTALGVPKYGVKTVAREGYDPKTIRSTVTQLRQAEKRLAEVQKAKKAEVTRREFMEGVYYYEDSEAMRLGFEFDRTPSREVCRYLAKAGFRYSPSKERWQRLFNSSGRAKARQVRQRLKELL